MQFRYLFGTLVLISVTYRCAIAEVGATISKNGGSAVKSDSQRPNAGKAKGSPERVVVPAESGPKPAESVRSSSSTGDQVGKSSNPVTEAKAPNKAGNEGASGSQVIQPAPLEKPKVSSSGDNMEEIKTRNQIPIPESEQTTSVSVGEEVKSTKSSIKPAKILVMLPMPMYSHTQNYMPIFKELAKRGHHVTVVSPYPQNVSLSTWEEIPVENILNKIMAAIPNRDFSTHTSFISKLIGLMMFAGSSLPLTLELKPLLELYNDDSREFDLVFVEAQFAQEPLLAFGHKFKAPVIALFPSYIVPEVAYYTGNPVMTSTYVPHMLLKFSNCMTFIERATNTLFSILKLLIYNLYVVPGMDRKMREYISEDLPYLGDMLFNISFTLLDAHPIMNYPYPRVNNIREFLGINTEATGELSPELQEYMDGGEDGVLLFTLGSHYEMSTLKPHILNSMLQAFSRLPNKILMKWDKDEPPVGLPSNVKTGKWFPQTAVLAHKNCVGFITHTGVHGLVESVFHAVPVISVPLFADQHFFARWVVDRGIGLSIDIGTITPQVAYETINAVITNKKYKENVYEISQLMNDLPMPTLDEITYWVEYVIRTKGARLLRPGSLNLPWYQRFGLDLLAAAVAITAATLWILISVLKCLVSMCTRKGLKKDSTTVKDKSKKAKKRD